MEKIILQNHIVTYALDAKILSMYETKCWNTNNEKEFDIIFLSALLVYQFFFSSS